MDIAVVDDEKIIRGHICEMIEIQKPDCHVACFSSGEELLAAEKPFDIIFLDIQMDGMNGIEAAKEIREENADTVLIFITGIKEYVFEALDLYAFHYLLKPVTEQKFTPRRKSLKLTGHLANWKRSLAGHSIDAAGAIL